MLTPGLPADVVAVLAKMMEDGEAENTKRAHESDLRYFWAWAAARLNLVEAYPVAPAVVLTFLADHYAGMPEEVEAELLRTRVKRKKGLLARNTITRRLYTLSAAHTMRGLESPLEAPGVGLAMGRMENACDRQGRGTKAKKAITAEILGLLLSTCAAGTLEDLRDQAVILCGLKGGGRRRSEIAAALMEDLEEALDGYRWHIPCSKTDIEGHGLVVAILGPAAAALRSWLETSGITSGKVFRGLTKGGKVLPGICAETVANIVKRRAERAGLDPALFAGHSLRSGFMTEAGRENVPLADAMAMSDHKSVSVAKAYMQAGAPHLNPGARLFEEVRPATVSPFRPVRERWREESTMDEMPTWNDLEMLEVDEDPGQGAENSPEADASPLFPVSTLVHQPAPFQVSGCPAHLLFRSPPDLPLTRFEGTLSPNLPEIAHARSSPVWRNKEFVEPPQCHLSSPGRARCFPAELAAARLAGLSEGATSGQAGIFPCRVISRQSVNFRHESDGGPV